VFAVDNLICTSEGGNERRLEEIADGGGSRFVFLVRANEFYKSYLLCDAPPV